MWLAFVPIPCLIATFALMIRAEDKTPRDEAQIRIWKPASTALVILVCGLSLASPTHLPAYTALVLVALVLCLIGDMLLIRRDDTRSFALGLASFLAGHGLLIVALAVAQSHLGLPINLQREVLAGALLAVLVAVVYVYLRPHLGSLRGPVVVYMAVISLMVHRAVSGLYTGPNVPAQPMLAVAAALMFYTSDFILAINRFAFGGDLPRASWLVLGTYYVAILLFALSASFL